MTDLTAHDFSATPGERHDEQMKYHVHGQQSALPPFDVRSSACAVAEPPGQ